MQKAITLEVVVAYVHCPRKAFLLLCTEEQGTPHEYPRILAQQQRTNQNSYVNGLKQRHPEATAYGGTLPDAGRGMLLAVTLRAQEKDIDVFNAARRARTSVAVGASTGSGQT